MREINAQMGRVRIHPISRTTVTGLPAARTAEGDGVPQMLHANRHAMTASRYTDSSIRVRP